MAIQTRPAQTTVDTRLVRLVTADQYRLLPETNTICELINGELVISAAPLPKHQWAVLRLARLLEDLVLKDGTGVVFIAPVDVYLGTLEVYQPDILVILRKNISRLTDHGITGPPDLVVEVLSPSNRKQDLVTKAAEYAGAGVPEYWVVDPSNDRIEVNRLEGGAYVAVVSADGNGRSVILSGLEVAPADIFTMPAWMTRPAPSAAPVEE